MVRVGERWKNADEIEVGDVVRPIGTREWVTVTQVWPEGDTVTVTGTYEMTVTTAGGETSKANTTTRLPILAPKERVEVDPQA